MAKPANAEVDNFACTTLRALRTCCPLRGSRLSGSQRENTCGQSCYDGQCRCECNADPHGTSLRRAREGARLCSVGAGSGHCIRAPNGEREGIVRSGMVAAGCAAGCVKARGLSSVCPRFVVVQAGPGGQACQDPDRSVVGRNSITYWENPVSTAPPIDQKVRLRFVTGTVAGGCDNASAGEKKPFYKGL